MISLLPTRSWEHFFETLRIDLSFCSQQQLLANTKRAATPLTAGNCSFLLSLYTCSRVANGYTTAREEIARTIKQNEGLFLVVEEGESLIGAVMGCYDGRRGWVNHLAVDPDCHGKQVGRLLLEELEKRFRQIGCKKVNLLVQQSNNKVLGFYEKLGYQTDDVIFMEKWID